MSERTQIGEFAAAVGVNSAANYIRLHNSLNVIQRATGMLAVGILMSEKTGLLGVENRHGPGLYPLFDEVEAIADAHTRLRWAPELIVHYNTDNPDRVGGQLLRALGPIAPNVNGVQVNGLDFAQATDLAKVKEALPHIAVIMQINSRLLRLHSPKSLVENVNRTPMIDYVWLDDSGGNNIVLDPNVLLPYVAALYEDTDVGIGMGGGLSPGNMRR